MNRIFGLGLPLALGLVTGCKSELMLGRQDGGAGDVSDTGANNGGARSSGSGGSGARGLGAGGRLSSAGGTGGLSAGGVNFGGSAGGIDFGGSAGAFNFGTGGGGGVGGGIDSTTCKQGFRPEACHEYDLPPCAPTWAQALERYSELWCAEGNISLSGCKTVTASYSDGFHTYQYDDSGALVGESGSTRGQYYCTDYTTPPFRPPPIQCLPLNLPCSADGGLDTCGNGLLDNAAEECDGLLPAGMTCQSYTMGAKPNGMLQCTPTCRIDWSGCRPAN